jgi:hypothetical protein
MFVFSLYAVIGKFSSCLSAAEEEFARLARGFAEAETPDPVNRLPVFS